MYEYSPKALSMHNSMLTSSGYFIDGYFLQTSWQDFSNSDESLFYDGKKSRNWTLKNHFCLSFKIKAIKANKKTIPRGSVATLFMLET